MISDAQIKGLFDRSRPLGADKNAKAFFILAALATISFIAWLIARPETSFDDSYMYIRYADNILAGYGHVWNIGEDQIYGSTSPFYCLWVTLLRALLPFDAAGVLLAASLLPGLLSIALLARVNSDLLGYGNYWKHYTFYLFAFIACSPFSYHAHTGMDTNFALFFNVVMIYAGLGYLRQDSIRNAAFVLCSALLGFWARPDNLIVSLMFPSLLIFLFKPQGFKKAVAFSLLALSFIALDLAFKYWLFNDPLPLAFYAKKNGFYEGYIGLFQWNPVFFTLWFAASTTIYTVITQRVWDGRTRILGLVFLSPLLVTFIYYMSIVQIMGIAARYYLPFIPFVAVFAFISNQHTTLWEFSRWKNIIAKTAIQLGVVIGLGFLFITPYGDYLSSKQEVFTANTKIKTMSEEPLPVLSRFFVVKLLSKQVATLPKNTKVLISEYGRIGAMANHIAIIDPVGLHDRETAHKGVSISRMLQKDPDIIMMLHIHYTKLRADLIDNPDFQANFDFYPSAFRHGIAINRNSKRYEENRAWFNALWRDAYGELNADEYKARYIHAKAQ